MNKLYVIIRLVLLSPVFFSGCIKETESPVLTADFTVSTTEAWTGDTVTFTNNTEGAFYYNWEFGDGAKSTLENPTHVYFESGGYEVVLRAVGSFSSDSSHILITIKPRNGKIIDGGKGIEEFSLGTPWDTVQAILTSVDTSYFSSYSAASGIYSNWVYYHQSGIAVGFLSRSAAIENDDSVYVIGLVSPYQGLTPKEITIGSRLTRVISAYGEPEAYYNTAQYTGYKYPSLGIDFYANNFPGNGLVTEIDIYYPE
jgi:hypothetical protein